MKFCSSRTSAFFAFTVSLITSGLTRAATVIDQIGDAGAYGLNATPGPKLSQIFTDQASYSSMVLEDFTVAEPDLRISAVSALFRAGGGYSQFQNVPEYAFAIFSTASLATSSLAGDVANLLVSAGSNASVIEISDSGGLYEYGLVSLNVDVLLPAAGTYWFGVAPKSSLSATGQFYLLSNGASGGTPGNSSAKFANPGGGYGSADLSVNPAYALTVVPEPGAVTLSLLASFALLCRRSRNTGPTLIKNS